MKRVIALVLTTFCGLALGQNTHLSTTPENVDSSTKIRASFRAKALETIDLIGLAESVDNKPDVIFIPAELKAKEAFDTLGRTETTEGERGVHDAIIPYLFAVDECQMTGACQVVSDRKDEAIRAVKKAEVEQIADDAHTPPAAATKVAHHRK